MPANRRETDVLVIGGGATGAGIAWDLALRGVRVVLAEMGDLATGTSGRYHGLLHSGGRYAVNDPGAAKECIDENRILRTIVPSALEDTGGLFVAAPDDGDEYISRWLAACQRAGIPTNAISVAEARRREPALNPALRAVYEVPDASCDSWDLAHALQQGCEAAGGVFLTYHRIDSFHMEQNRVVGARLTNLRANVPVDIGCAVAINAAGPWAAQITALAGAPIQMGLSRGAMLAFNVRWVNTVINRLRPPGDGDIIVPVGTVSVTGTTSVRTDDPGDTRVERWEVERILTLTDAMTPGISRARLLRAWGGVRPLYDPGAADEGRELTRNFTVLDHAQSHGVEGFISILGGKLTTFRLMAERTADAACAKLGVTTPCATATTPLPDHDAAAGRRYHALDRRLGKLEHGKLPGPLLCECEIVTAPQVAEALHSGDVVTLNDLRRDLRLGMGPCQGGFCAYRAAAFRHTVTREAPGTTDDLLAEFVERRFGGMKPLLWGHNLRQVLLAEHIYGRIVGLTPQPAPAPAVPTFVRRETVSAADRGPRILVVGAGLAGMMAALAATDAGAQVELVAFGQGAFVLHPGWIEVGDVDRLAETEGHPYRHSAAALADGLALLDSAIGLTPGPFDALTAMGKRRPVAFAAGIQLHAPVPNDLIKRIAIVGIDHWRDFYPALVADRLRGEGFDAEPFDIQLYDEIGNFDEWPVDVAHLLDTAEGARRLIEQVKPRVRGAAAVGFPAVLGFRAATRARIADALGCPIFEIPTLPPSVPGLRLYGALRAALFDRGARMTLGSRVTGLARENGRVTGVQAATASGRPRIIRGEAVILATGGLYGGGLDSDYRGHIHETIAGLPVSRAPDGDWFALPFVSGQPQPIHWTGIATDAMLRPLNAENADGQPAADNLFAAGRLLAGSSPIAEGSVEGVDIATGVHAARCALAAAGHVTGMSRDERANQSGAIVI